MTASLVPSIASGFESIRFGHERHEAGVYPPHLGLQVRQLPGHGLSPTERFGVTLPLLQSDREVGHLLVEVEVPLHLDRERSASSEGFFAQSFEAVDDKVEPSYQRILHVRSLGPAWSDTDSRIGYGSNGGGRLAEQPADVHGLVTVIDRREHRRYQPVGDGMENVRSSVGSHGVRHAVEQLVDFHARVSAVGYRQAPLGERVEDGIQLFGVRPRAIGVRQCDHDETVPKWT